jgi:hypothetical protein
MSKYITEAEFAQLQADRKRGAVEVSLPREVARQFFLRITSSEVKATTGKSIALQKLLVWICTITSPILFVASLVFFAMTHSAWESTLILPIAGICWTVIYGLTSNQGGWLIGTVPLVICAFPMASSGANTSDPLFLFVLSIWLQRASYLLADRWLMAIVMRHFEAFEMMEAHLQIETN